MAKENIALILGGTFPHIELIHSLKRRGYRTVLIDYYPEPPAKAVADEHIQESTLDQEKVLEIARAIGAGLVISTCIDQANVTATYVSEQLGLPAPYSFETALSATNKSLMKKRMCRGGIPTSDYRIIQDGDETVHLSYPLIVKPVDSNSSKGVRRVTKWQELQSAARHALSMSRSGRAIVEEFVEGEEVGVDCFVSDGIAQIVMTRVRKKIDAQHHDSQQICGSIWPAPLPRKIYEELTDVANRIASVFQLDNTPLLMQTIVHEGGISVIEFAPRIGGGENYRIIRSLTGFDIIDATVDSFLGQPVKPKFDHPRDFSVDCYLYVKPGLYGSIVHEAKAGENGMVDYLVEYKSRGSKIGNELSSNNRVGAFVVTSKRLDIISRKIGATLAAIDVIDVCGRSILRRTLYSPFVEELSTMSGTSVPTEWI